MRRKLTNRHEYSEHNQSDHTKIAEKPVTENLLKILNGKNTIHTEERIGEFPQTSSQKLYK